MADEIVLKTFNIAPLQGEALTSYSRLPSDVQSMVNEVVNSPGGSFLVTGYRGVGKTSFVNKVLNDTSARFQAQGLILLQVKLSLARGYSTDKLLRRIIRELNYAIVESGIHDSLPVGIQRELHMSFLRTSRQIKAALSQGLKEAVVHSEAKGATVTSSVSTEPKIGIGDFSLSLASFGGQRSTSKTIEDTKSTETSKQYDWDMEFLEYDDEIAESDLDSLINSLVAVRLNSGAPSPIIHQLKRPAFFWKRLPSEFRVFGHIVKNYGAILVPPAANSLPDRIRIVIVLDEVDKMAVDQAEEMFRSLKNLFLNGNATFIVISGKEFYYEWLNRRSSEDDILYSLFTRIVHVPLFSDAELQSVAQSLLADSQKGFPQDLLTHLLLRAKGTPREFLRELMRFVRWEETRLVVSMQETRIVSVSNQLYPYAVKLYEPIERDVRIDPGIKDHLRRNLHNWLQEMILYVTFDKEALLRVRSANNNSANFEFLGSKTPSLLDGLLNELLAGKVLEVNVLPEGRRVYTFASEIKGRLDSVDASVEMTVQAAIGAAHRQAEQLRIEALRLTGEDRLDEALVKLSEAGILDPANVELKTLRDDIDARRQVKALLESADAQYRAGQYELAVATYNQVRETGAASSDLSDKLLMATLSNAVAAAEQGLQTTGDYQRGIRLLEDAIASAKASFDPRVVEICQQAQSALETSWQAFERSAEVEKLINEDLDRAQSTLDKLDESAPNSRRTKQLHERLLMAYDLQRRLVALKRQLQQRQSQEDIESLRAMAATSYGAPSFAAKELLSSLIELQKMIKKADQDLKDDDMIATAKIVADIEAIAGQFSISWPEIDTLRTKVQAERHVIQLLNDFSSAIESDSLTAAWDIVDDIMSVEGSASSAVAAHKRAYRRVKTATLDKAQNLLGEALAVSPSRGGVMKAARPDPSDDPRLVAVKIARILDPLLKHEPDNSEAKALLDTAKSLQP